MNAMLKDILDVVAKLTAAVAILITAIVANSFQSSNIATTLLSQREQADSTLRASMFQDLIGPILESEKGNTEHEKSIPVEREKLLIELLALNFHEHFELKPLMLHVDNRLAQEEARSADQTQGGSARESLRSIAHQIAERQIAMLTKSDAQSPAEQQTCIYRLELKEPTQEAKQPSPPNPCSARIAYFNDLISIDSPNGTYSASFTITPKSWEEQTFDIKFLATENNKSKVLQEDAYSQNLLKLPFADTDITLTKFDLPFSDNTLLGDGTRFSLVLDELSKTKKEATIKLIWFPQDYFPARERPTNHRQFREKLGLTLD